MSTAIVQGASGGLGSALAAHLLKTTSLKVYALTLRSASDLEAKLSGSAEDAKDRLKVIGDVDVTKDDSLARAAEQVRAETGAHDVRLIACLAGILRPEKSLGAIDPAEALRTFQINALGHLFTYKHFVPLLPSKNDFNALSDRFKAEKDPAEGLVDPDGSLCFSLSARVGSIADNERGGWYSYRASKAALNQVIRSLDHELVHKSSSGMAMAYHPGTVLTDLSRPVVGSKATPKPDQGIFSVDQAIEKMTGVMRQARRDDKQEWGGGFFDWRGHKVPW